MARTNLHGFLALGLLAACSGGTDPAAPDPLADPLAEGPVVLYPEAQQAFFPEFPDALLMAAVQSCVNPNQRLRQPDAESVICESLPSPEGAAALILTHNGTVENLPRLYTTFASRPSGEGYVVAGDTYISVPQRTGGVVRLRLPEGDGVMRDLLAQAGGQPFPIEPIPAPVGRAEG